MVLYQKFFFFNIKFEKGLVFHIHFQIDEETKNVSQHVRIYDGLQEVLYKANFVHLFLQFNRKINTLLLEEISIFMENRIGLCGEFYRGFVFIVRNWE